MWEHLFSRYYTLQHPREECHNGRAWGELSLSINKGMSFCAPPSDHILEEIRLYMDNLLLSQEHGIQDFYPLQDGALVRKS
ncbi:transcription factor bHLH77-like [Pyrus ussuriensis x Pyrus communis]|uniref:Transcription factor bHLH77-like n=1 Tax=Pyrus ussuriensis x Pyrus communis TaxID=2448454 RepID=A0A5N5HFC2_9ROSA|nr:transcription factor bHLH77-like [Pyrus ussuriensis x Pyrus communis]